MSSRAKKIMENARRGGGTSGSTPAPRSQPSQNPSGGSNNPPRALTSPTAPVTRSNSTPSKRDQNANPARPQRNIRSRESENSNPEVGRTAKRPREETELLIRRPGKEPVLEVPSDEDIESVMNSDHPRAGGLSIDTSVLDCGDEPKAWKVFKATIFKKDQAMLGRKHLKHNLKNGSRDLISVGNIMYQGYVIAERAFKDLDKSKNKLNSLAKTFAASSKEAEKKNKEIEDELRRKDDQLVDVVGQLSSRNLEVDVLKKKIEELNAGFERLKLESRENYEKGRAEGLSLSSRPTREQKLAIAREFFRSPVYDALSDMKAGVELFGVFDKGWKQCRKLGFLNERFDENALDPLKNDDCEPFPITENEETGPVLEEDEFYPLYLEAMDSGTSDQVVEQVVVTAEQPLVEPAVEPSGQHQVLTQEQIDHLFDHGVPGGDGPNAEGFDHIDVTNLVGDGTHNQE